MSRFDRRSFLKAATASIACAMTGRPRRVFATVDGSADLILKNGAIVTMNDKQPTAAALAVRGGRILAVGSNEEIARLAATGTRTIDLAGRSVSPGLIDGHSHVIGFGQMQLKFVLLRPPKVNSFDTLRAELAKAAKDKEPGEWIVGRGFDTFKEGRFPRRQELDEAVRDNPTLIIHWGGQFGAANTLALKKAGLLRKDAKDPYGGKYLRERKTGLPDGVLLHYPAIYSVYHPELDEKEQMECARWGMRQFAASGVTCIHDNFCSPRHAANYVRLEQMGELPCRVRVYPYVANLETCQQAVSKVRRYDGRLVRLQGIKLAVDGYALMYKIPREQQHLAIPMHPQPRFDEIIETIHKADLQADVHAMGDKGVDWTLEAYEKAAGSASECRNRRHRIEHFAFRKVDSIRRAADLGVPVCTQPTFVELKADDFRDKLGLFGKDYVEKLLPVRTFVKEDVHLAFGADVPAFPSHQPMESIRCALERRTGGGRQLDTDEAVSFMEALRCHTLSTAYASFDEAELGSLETGKCADFVIWNKDLAAVRTGRDAAALKPDATYLAGEPVYQADHRDG